MEYTPDPEISHESGNWIHGVQLLSRDSPEQRNCSNGIPQSTACVQIHTLTHRPQTKTSPIWQHTSSNHKHSSTFSLYSEPTNPESGSYTLKIDCMGSGVFIYSNTAIKIFWEADGTNADHYFHSFGLAFWLEQRNIPCLHANSLVINGSGIGLMTHTGGGKSTLTAALLQRGHQLLADDMLPLHHHNEQWPIFPGPPDIRLWPDSGSHFVTSQTIDAAKRVHAGFEKRTLCLKAKTGKALRPFESTPLSALYLLDRTTNQQPPRIEPLSPSQALVALLENSLIGGAPRKMGIESTRLALLAELTAHIPIKRLRYPSGFNQLNKVCDILEADISQRS